MREGERENLEKRKKWEALDCILYECIFSSVADGQTYLKKRKRKREKKETDPQGSILVNMMDFTSSVHLS